MHVEKKKGKGFVGGGTEEAGGMYYSFRPCRMYPESIKGANIGGGGR